MSLAQLRAARAQKIKEAKALLDANPTADASILERVAALKAEADALTPQITAAEAADALRAEINAEAAKIPAPRAATQTGPVVASVKDLSKDDPAHGFKSQREYFQAVMQAGLGQRPDKRLAGLRPTIGAAAGSDEAGEYSDPHGGFLVPAAFRPELLTVPADADPTANLTTRIPMGSPRVEIPARTDKNHATSVTGGLKWSRRAETQEAASSRMEMEKVVLNATSANGVAFTTEELISDSAISFIALLQGGFRDEYGAFIFNEKIRGTGTGEYQGILNSPAKIEVAKESGQTADTIVYDNILKMRSRCWGFNRAIWLANHDTFPQLAKLSLAVGVAGAAVYMPSAIGDRPDMLLGRPIFYTEFADTLGDAGDLILCDWSQYLEGELEGMSMAESIHVRFLANERCFKVGVRNDGRSWWRSALTPKKGANTLSPIVTLAARA